MHSFNTHVSAISEEVEDLKTNVAIRQCSERVELQPIGHCRNHNAWFIYNAHVHAYGLTMSTFSQMIKNTELNLRGNLFAADNLS